MRRKFALIVVVAAALAAATTAGAADPPAIPRGATMLQDFQGYKTTSALDGCLLTLAAINFSRPMQQAPGEHAIQAWVWVQSVNYCTYQATVILSGFLSEATLHLTPNAKYAHAVGEGFLQNSATGASSLVSVDVTFVPESVRRWTQDPHQTFVHVATSEGKATGSVTVDGVDYFNVAGDASQRFTVDAWLLAPIGP